MQRNDWATVENMWVLYALNIMKLVKNTLFGSFKGYVHVFLLNATGFDTFERAQVGNPAINKYDLWKAWNYIYKYI